MSHPDRGRTCLRVGAATGLDLAEWIRPGDGIVWGQACAEPTTLTGLLAAQASILGPLSGFAGITLADELAPAARPGSSLRLTSYSAAGHNRRWHSAGGLEMLPVSYSALPQLIRRRDLPADVVMLLVGPPDLDGSWRLGLADEYLSAALDVARVVLLEESPRVPRVPGARRLHPADVDAVVVSDREPVPFPATTPSPIDEALAGRVAALVPDGATLAVGVGGVPAAVLAALSDHNDLGIHSGLLTDGVVELAERGVITNAAKDVDRGISVGGLVMGTRRVFDWVDGNPAVSLRRTELVHDQAVLRGIRRFTALTAALEVDLTGQVNAESVDGRYLGSAGGLLDFLRGARAADNGVPITALRSTSQGRSRLVRRLSGPATVGCADVGIVVTEHGHADLRGLGLDARREALLAIAHPDHRSELVAAD